MDLYDEIAALYEISDGNAYLLRRTELIEAVGEMAYLIVSERVSDDRHARIVARREAEAEARWRAANPDKITDEW